jgi:hypothetical protein
MFSSKFQRFGLYWIFDAFVMSLGCNLGSIQLIYYFFWVHFVQMNGLKVMWTYWNEYFELKNIRCLFCKDKKNYVDMQNCIEAYNKILKDVI